MCKLFGNAAITTRCDSPACSTTTAFCSIAVSLACRPSCSPTRYALAGPLLIDKMATAPSSVAINPDMAISSRGAMLSNQAAAALVSIGAACAIGASSVTGAAGAASSLAQKTAPISAAASASHWRMRGRYVQFIQFRCGIGSILPCYLLTILRANSHTFISLGVLFLFPARRTPQ